MPPKLEKRRSILVGMSKSEPSLKGQRKAKTKWTTLSEAFRRGKTDTKMGTLVNSKMAKSKMSNPIQRSAKSIVTNDIRAAKHEYQSHIDNVKDEHEEEIKELCANIAFLKRDNEKMTRNQTQKWGLSLDEMQFLKADLEKAKSVNSALLREIDAKKEETEKLQGDIDELVYHIALVEEDMDYWLEERRQFAAERERLQRVEAKIKLLDISNRGLRSFLIWKKINLHSPVQGVVEPEIDVNNKTVMIKSPKSDSYLLNRYAYTPDDYGRFPKVFNRNNLLDYVRRIEDMQVKRSRGRHTHRPVSNNLRMDPKEFIRRSQREAWLKVRPAYVFL